MNEDIKKNEEVLDEENLEKVSGGVLRIQIDSSCDPQPDPQPKTQSMMPFSGVPCTGKGKA